MTTSAIERRAARALGLTLALTLWGGCGPPGPGAKFVEVLSPVSPGSSPAMTNGSGAFSFVPGLGDGGIGLLVGTGYSLANFQGAGKVAPAPQVLAQAVGPGQFQDVSAAHGLGFTAAVMGTLAADLDGDGDIDLLVPGTDPGDGGPAPSHLFENRGGVFVDRGPLDPSLVGTTYSICAADFDGDGDLDLFLANHVDLNGVSQDTQGFEVGEPDRLYRNDGNFVFTNVSADAGAITHDRAWTNACMAMDYDGDGKIDLWVAYEQYPVGVTLYRNLGNMQFEDVSDRALGGAHQLIGNWMGFAAGDYDGDGNVDVFVTNDGTSAYQIGGTTVTTFANGYALHLLLHNNGDGTFTDEAPKVPVQLTRKLPRPDLPFPTEATGVASLEFGWTANFVDFDNDGSQDLYFAGAWAFSRSWQVIGTAGQGANPGRLLQNDGKGRFIDVADTAGVLDQDPSGFFLDAWGSGFADLDQNGFPDLVVANQFFGDPAYPGDVRVFLNQGNRNGWLDVDLRGTRSGPHGYGARVQLTTSKGVQVQQRVAASSISGQSTLPLHFGLGTATPVELTVNWPSGQVSRVEQPAARTVVVVAEP